MTTMESLTRERVVTLSDPAITMRAGRQMAGLEFLRALRDGVLPPPPAIVLLAGDDAHGRD